MTPLWGEGAYSALIQPSFISPNMQNLYGRQDKAFFEHVDT